MPLISSETIKSFLGDKSFITKDLAEVAGMESAIAQADNIVFQKTLIPIPASVDDAIPMLQYFSHVIFIYLVGTRQTLNEDDRKHRAKMYDDAMAELNDISEGKKIVYDSTGAVVSKSQTSQASTFYYSADDSRSERL